MLCLLKQRRHHDWPRCPFSWTCLWRILRFQLSVEEAEVTCAWESAKLETVVRSLDILSPGPLLLFSSLPTLYLFPFTTSPGYWEIEQRLPIANHNFFLFFFTEPMLLLTGVLRCHHCIVCCQLAESRAEGTLSSSVVYTRQKETFHLPRKQPARILTQTSHREINTSVSCSL